MTELLAQRGYFTASSALVLVASFIVALIVSLLLTRALRGRATALALTESPRHLNEFAPPVAKVGGIAIALAIAGAGSLMWGLFGDKSIPLAEYGPIMAVMGGAGVMCLLGLWDDLRELRARTKVVVQVLAAVVVWIAGVRFGSFAAPSGLVTLMPALSLIVTVFWFVGLTNAFNLVDGADGVAGGAALTATLAMFVVSLYLGQSLAAHVLVVTAGALVGFLFYNFPPATVYLGDAGSLALGFLLAGVGVVTSSKATTLLAVAIPVVSLGLPIMDTSLAMVRRIIRGESVARRDLGHIHHRLRKIGHSPRQVALHLFGASATMALASLLLLSDDLQLVGLIYAVLGIVAFVGIQRLKMPELLDLRRAIVRGLPLPGNGNGRASAWREAVSAMLEAGELAAKFEVLEKAFESTDFVEAEIRLAERRSDESQSDRLLWRWTRPGSARADTDWVAKGPLLADGKVVAWLVLRRPWWIHTPNALDVLTHGLGSALGLEVGAGKEEVSQVENSIFLSS